MSSRVVFQGIYREIQTVIQMAITRDLPMSLVVIPASTDEVNQYRDLIASAEGCHAFSLSVGTSTDYQDAELIVIFDLDWVENEHPNRVSIATFSAGMPRFRRIINDIVESGFDGNLLFAGAHDEQMLLFAAQFSGMAAHRLLGLGTYPESRILANRLEKRLGLGKNDVRVYVIGTSSNNFVAWSRTTFGPAPALMYLANSDNPFSVQEMSSSEDWIQSESIQNNLFLRMTSLLDVTKCLLTPNPAILTITNLQPGKELVALSTPVLINQRGVQRLTELSLSESENHDFTELVATVKTEKAQVEANQAEDM
ncbi:hypothetical protein [Levilactobacillus bambusae]|uniref:Lactate dehydrogenase n=1 Tax=Levilactobacillus bambusae TaxID=2024736 RepID=A0A2V1N1T6_9LACO|nr:hypothetical protein [Levilactobacillus bambusae]PWG00668.1 hypothetical protein DCM90_00390 [Levilactobacillus bambusae]